MRLDWDPPFPRDPQRDGDGKIIGATDWLGSVFKVGDQVTYCIGAGRGQMMAIGKVLKFKSEEKERAQYRELIPGETPRYTETFSGKTYVRYRVRYDVVTVQVLTLKTSGRWDNKMRSKPAWVNPMNITALPLEGLPEVP